MRRIPVFAGKFNHREHQTTKNWTGQGKHTQSRPETFWTLPCIHAQPLRHRIQEPGRWARRSARSRQTSATRSNSVDLLKK
jgi:hypothetical protein